MPFPCERAQFIRRVESLFQLADTIEKRTAIAQQRVEKMTQAILAKAFRGELVPTEAELARQDGRAYEPASVLLEQIRAESVSATSDSRKGKPRTSTKQNHGQNANATKTRPNN